MTDLSPFKDFPSFPFAGEEVCVPVLEFQDIRVEIGMWAVWRDSEPFRIEAIRIDPTLRFWTGQDWAIAANCRIV